MTYQLPSSAGEVRCRPWGEQQPGRSGVELGNLVEHRVVRIRDRPEHHGLVQVRRCHAGIAQRDVRSPAGPATDGADEVILQVRLVGDEPAQQGIPDGGVRQPAGFERTGEFGHHEFPSAIDAVTRKA
jgi:hypothetical protein